MRHRWKAALKILTCLLVTSVSAFAKEKPVVVLVHGAFQDGANTWAKVEPELEAKGYKVVVGIRSCPSHGDKGRVADDRRIDRNNTAPLQRTHPHQNRFIQHFPNKTIYEPE